MSTIKDFEHLKIPLQSIKLATNDFGDDNYISQGGFGKVYKGELDFLGDRVTVAVKRLNSIAGQGTPEFWKEIMMLSRYRHQHLVSLLGYSDEDDENILVYEYVPNKSLDMYLSSPTLSWIQRLKICIGAASGLQYLHNPDATTQRVLHRDIKSSNILLDENWNAKISDFGLSKFGPANQELTFLISHVVGTPGYCDPLYMDTGYLTKESDIYSFGVVLFEVLCGRISYADYNDDRRYLSELAKKCHEENKIDTIVHSCLQEQISPNCLEKFSTIAYQCLQRDRNKRPPITEIIKQLEVVLEDQVRHNLEKEKKVKSHGKVKKEVHLGDMSLEELKAYDGCDPKKPLLMAIKGQIYDVSRSKMFYGPDGPYAIFAAKDASRALAKVSFEENDLNADLTGLDPFELEALQDWEDKFKSKYVKVGCIKDSKLGLEKEIESNNINQTSNI